jgi:hypothetical protein
VFLRAPNKEAAGGPQCRAGLIWGREFGKHHTTVMHSIANGVCLMLPSEGRKRFSPLR